jgi:hypothetical protein
MTNTFDEIMEIEDALQLAGVFFSEIGGTRRTAHSDSYGTCVDFVLLDKMFEKSEFNQKRWSDAVLYWTTNENMQPPLRLVGYTLQRKLGLNYNSRDK